MLTQGTCQFSALLSFYMNITVFTFQAFPSVGSENGALLESWY